METEDRLENYDRNAVTNQCTCTKKMYLVTDTEKCAISHILNLVMKFHVYAGTLLHLVSSIENDKHRCQTINP